MELNAPKRSCSKPFKEEKRPVIVPLSLASHRPSSPVSLVVGNPLAKYHVPEFPFSLPCDPESPIPGKKCLPSLSRTPDLSNKTKKASCIGVHCLVFVWCLTGHDDLLSSPKGVEPLPPSVRHCGWRVAEEEAHIKSKRALVFPDPCRQGCLSLERRHGRCVVLPSREPQTKKKKG